jgi:hypothetical protein
VSLSKGKRDHPRNNGKETGAQRAHGLQAPNSASSSRKFYGPLTRNTTRKLSELRATPLWSTSWHDAQRADRAYRVESRAEGGPRDRFAAEQAGRVSIGAKASTYAHRPRSAVPLG